jgi:hypothetical protein
MREHHPPQPTASTQHARSVKMKTAARVFYPQTQRNGLLTSKLPRQAPGLAAVCTQPHAGGSATCWDTPPALTCPLGTDKCASVSYADNRATTLRKRPGVAAPRVLHHRSS